MICPKCQKEIQENISFCPHCGYYVNKVQNGFSTFENNLSATKVDEINDKVEEQRRTLKIEKTKKTAINIKKQPGKKSAAILYILTIILWSCAIFVIIKTSKGEYFFSDSDSDPVTETDMKDNNYSGVSKSGQNDLKSSLDTTSIVYDNQYLKQTIFNTIDDVYALIDYDSNSQKKNCPANTKVVEENIIKSYNIRAVNLCEMNEAFAKELAEVARWYYNRYPNARGYMTNLTLANVDQGVTYMAAFMPLFTLGTSNTSSNYPVAYKTQIILNAKYFIDYTRIENSVANGRNTGYFPPNATRSSAVAHEFGHYVSYVAMLNYYNTENFTLTKQNRSELIYKVYSDFNNGDFSYKVLQDAYSYYHGSYTFDEFRASISKYAVAKNKNGGYVYDETIAEAYHDVYVNGDNAKEASKLIIQALEKYL